MFQEIWKLIRKVFYINPYRSYEYWDKDYINTKNPYFPTLKCKRCGYEESIPFNVDDNGIRKRHRCK